MCLKPKSCFLFLLLVIQPVGEGAERSPAESNEGFAVSVQQRHRGNEEETARASPRPD